MRNLVVSCAMLILLLLPSLFLVSIVKAGVWSSPSKVTDPIFCRVTGDTRPSISGDGSKIAFNSDTDEFISWDKLNMELFIINSDGTGLTQLTNDTKFNNEYIGFGQPSLSDDGGKISFRFNDGTGYEVFVINSDGTGLRQLTDSEFGPGSSSGMSYPSISDDGSIIAFLRQDFESENWNRGIFVINSDGTEEKQLTKGEHGDFSMSGDGSKIAFLGADEFDFQYFVINSDGTGLTQLTRNTNQFQDINNDNIGTSAPSISDDGSKVAFVGYVGGDTEIFMINSDGTRLRQLTDNDESDWGPAISGDGNRIVFHRSALHQLGIKETRIFVINSDGTGLTQLTDDPYNYDQSGRNFLYPSISDDGDRIVFWTHLWSGDYTNYENGIYLVSYLSDSEDSNGAAATFLSEIAVGGTLVAAAAVMVIVYLKKKPRKWY